jgi:hypothetical protein
MRRIMFVILVLSIIGLMGCHDSKYHLDKFYKKGGKFTCDTTLVEVPTYIKGADGKIDTIIKKVPCNCPEVEVPKTRFEIRFDHKRFKDSLAFVKNMAKSRENFIIDSLQTQNKKETALGKAQAKVDKQAEKTKKAAIKGETKWQNTLLLSLLLLTIIVLIIWYETKRKRNE